MSKKEEIVEGGQPGEGSRKISVDEALRMATDRHRMGRLEEAQALYQGVLRVNPAHPDALHFLGVLHHMCGNRTEAESLVRQALDAAPENPHILNNLGNILREEGRRNEAAEAYQQALKYDPNLADAHSNLGAWHRDNGRLEQALASYRRAVEVTPGHSVALNNMGNVLAALDRNGEAVEAYQAAIRVGGDQATALQGLGSTLGNSGRFNEAESAFREALRFSSGEAWVKAMEGLARVYVMSGRMEDANIVYREWIASDPENPIPHHLLGAWAENTAIPERASANYVSCVFDRFADSFDLVLENLEYRAPYLVTRALKVMTDAQKGHLDVLDAGCGTGLCGPLLRPLAVSLTGVDLSEKMLDKARERAVYDELIADDLCHWMLSHPACYDAVVSADTLCYFGDLAPPFGAAAKALRPNGRLVFTVENIEDNPPEVGYRLNPHGRYSHVEDYVETMLTESGFRLEALVRDVLRKENKKPVAGLIVTAVRSASP